MSEGLPVGWTARPVGEAGEVLLGRQRSPDQMTGQHPTPYLRVANVLDGHIDYSDVLTMNFTPTERAVYGLRPGDILLNEGQSLDLVGRSSIYDGPPDTYCYQNTLVRFRPKPGLRSKYAQAVFSRWVRQRTLTQIAKQTTSIAHLGASRFAALMFPEPPEQEQQRIAEILDALDRAIRASEQVITKLEMLKRGLLHDLLSRGTDRSATTHGPGDILDAHAETAVGPLPRRWKTSVLHENAEIRTGIAKNDGAVPSDPIEVHYLRVANVQDGYLDLSEMKTIRLGRRELDQYRVLPGDVLMNEGGDRDKLGRGAVWTGALDLCVHQNHVFVVRCRPSLNAEFLAAWTSGDAAKRYFVRAGKQSTNLASINKTQIGMLPVPLPPLDEQARIVDILSAHTRRITMEQRELHKLSLLRHGLIDDLLTGRVRVSSHLR